MEGLLQLSSLNSVWSLIVRRHIPPNAADLPQNVGVLHGRVLRGDLLADLVHEDHVGGKWTLGRILILFVRLAQLLFLECGHVLLMLSVLRAGLVLLPLRIVRGL